MWGCRFLNSDATSSQTLAMAAFRFGLFVEAIGRAASNALGPSRSGLRPANRIISWALAKAPGKGPGDPTEAQLKSAIGSTTDRPRGDSWSR